MSEPKVENKIQRTLQGRVVSDKMQKTITVLVERRVKDSLYGKYLTRSTKFKAHDEANTAKIGDTVTIEQCRPISKDKSWRLVQVVATAPAAGV